MKEEEREELVGKMLWLPENFETYDQGRKDEVPTNPGNHLIKFYLEPYSFIVVG